MWQFKTLGDFADVISWLERHRRNNRRKKGWVNALRRITPILRKGLDEYQAEAERLNGIFNNILVNHAHPEIQGNVLANIQQNGDRLRDYFDKIHQLGDNDMITYWDKILFSRKHYTLMLKQLIIDFGNFEAILMTLPATGPMIQSDDVQKLLAGMYRLNTRNLRILEMLHLVGLHWRKSPENTSSGFLQPRTNLARITTSMLAEYMLEADPYRIAVKRKKLQQMGQPYVPYRFWRSAENVRLMAQLEYVGPKRKPHPRRRYIDFHFEPVTEICADIRRIEWSFREIFNNSLAACSHMYPGDNGNWIVTPLDKHDIPDPPAAIKLNVRSIEKEGLLGKRKYSQLEIRDDGVGIPPEHQPYITLWGYSPRRQEYEDRKKSPTLSSDKQDEIQIGGKGIGMPYSREVMLEHGGELYVTSKEGEGTTVILEFPCPTPLNLD